MDGLISNYVYHRKLLHMSMLNAMIISDMSIVSFIIKHPTFSVTNVMLRYVSDRIDGGARASVCGRSGGVCQACAFSSSRKPICCTDVDGDGSGDVSVQLLVSIIIVLHYKFRP